MKVGDLVRVKEAPIVLEYFREAIGVIADLRKISKAGFIEYTEYKVIFTEGGYYHHRASDLEVINESR